MLLSVTTDDDDEEEEEEEEGASCFLLRGSDTGTAPELGTALDSVTALAAYIGV